MAEDNFEQETTSHLTGSFWRKIGSGSLTFLAGEHKGETVEISREVFFIGRSQNNNLVLESRNVSRKHVVINYIDGEYTVSDLKSLGGIYLNGKKIQEEVLRHGDVLRIADITFRFSVGGVVEEKRSRWPWVLAFSLLVLLLAGGGYLYLERHPALPLMSAEKMDQIETHYYRGVEFFNKERDVEKAMQEWRKVLVLDPGRKTPYAVKVDSFITTLQPDNAPGKKP